MISFDPHDLAILVTHDDSGHPDVIQMAALNRIIAAEIAAHISIAGNPSLWAMHFHHVTAPGEHRCYHIGCLYPILCNAGKEAAMRAALEAACPFLPTHGTHAEELINQVEAALES